MSVENLRLGNIVTPNGASLIFGSEFNEAAPTKVDANTETYNPYTIVVVEEEDELIPADSVLYTDETAGTTKTVQDAITDVYQVAANATPTLITEMKKFTGGESSYKLTKTFFQSSMLVFYNGLLLNETIHYTFGMNKITLLDFTAEADDILTVVGLGSGGSTGSGGGTGSGSGSGELVAGGIYTFDCGTAEDVMEGGYLWQSQN